MAGSTALGKTGVYDVERRLVKFWESMGLRIVWDCDLDLSISLVLGLFEQLG